MNATKKAYAKLETILNTHGFTNRRNQYGNEAVIDMEKGTNYVNIQIWDKHDRYENTQNFEDFKAYGHLEVTASICRMGGEMDAAEFTRAADQMKRCSELMKELETADLSYVSRMDGEEA